MAEFDPQTVTLAELAKIYTEEQGLRKPLTLGPLFKDLANTPALEIFREDDETLSTARQKFSEASKNKTITPSTIKDALKTMRYLSNRLYKEYPKNPPDFLVPENTPSAAQRFFSVTEPPKAVSSLQVNPDPEVRREFMTKLIQYGADNPDKMPHVRAIIFGLNTGFRPNANIGVTPGEYIPNKGALYISGEKLGAKGRPISVPLNNIADSMLQQQLREFKDSIKTTGRIFVDTNGKPLKTTDINAVLEQIKVPDLVYDSKSGEYFDSFKPAGGDSSKFGMSLFRNYHTTTGRKLGVNDLVLAKLQGRSTKSYGRGSTGELSTYDSAFPGDVSEFERQQANIFTEAYSPDIDSAVSQAQTNNPDFRFDYGASTDQVTTRITARTEGYGSDYFTRPVEAKTDTSTKQDRVADAEAKLKAETPNIINKLLGLVGKGGAGVLAGLGIMGIATEAEAAASEEFRRSGSPLRAAGAGALRGTYELAETPLMMGLRAQPAGGPESSPITPEQQVAEGKTLEEQMGRIRQFEAKMGPGIGGPVPPQQRGLIDDEMSKLLQGE
jgi:integrase